MHEHANGAALSKPLFYNGYRRHHHPPIACNTPTRCRQPCAHLTPTQIEFHANGQTHIMLHKHTVSPAAAGSTATTTVAAPKGRKRARTPAPTLLQLLLPGRVKHCNGAGIQLPVCCQVLLPSIQHGAVQFRGHQGSVVKWWSGTRRWRGWRGGRGADSTPSCKGGKQRNNSSRHTVSSKLCECDGNRSSSQERRVSGVLQAYCQQLQQAYCQVNTLCNEYTVCRFTPAA